MKRVLLILILANLAACGTAQKIQYSAMEKVGIHKRDILIDRIEKTSNLQEETKQEFKSAYEQLTELVGVTDQKFESHYKALARSVEEGEQSAEKLKSRIASVDQVAKALFSEWKAELEEYQSQNLRRVSEQNLNTTKQKYARILHQMNAAYAMIQPVLNVLQDNTLYLKHNLNARAVRGISNEVLSVEEKVKVLIEQMENSIAESKQFVQSMKNKG